MPRTSSEKSVATRSNIEKRRWMAVQSRDAKADGAFVYAVKTTGVFCRPSCPSRRPLRQNVEFFKSADAAREAGYRVCKRCTPAEPGRDDTLSLKVQHACRMIETAAEPPSLKGLAKAAGYSLFHFQRVFKREVGLTPKQYEKAHREKRLREEISVSRTVTEAIFDAGFNSSAQFYAEASVMIGMTPASRRAKGRGETIRFAIGECSLGVLLVAATDKGVCAVSLHDDAKQMLDQFLDDFEGANIVGGDATFETLVANIVGLIENPQSKKSSNNIALDIRGTAFQKRVWQALSKIKPGATANYQDIANAIGHPNAVRAIAQACGANRIAVAIPCHRVIRSDGSLSGYRWGVERKRELLDREQAA